MRFDLNLYYITIVSARMQIEWQPTGGAILLAFRKVDLNIVNGQVFMFPSAHAPECRVGDHGYDWSTVVWYFYSDF